MITNVNDLISDQSQNLSIYSERSYLMTLNEDKEVKCEYLISERQKEQEIDMDFDKKINLNCKQLNKQSNEQLNKQLNKQLSESKQREMVQKILIILPTQLFDNKYIKHVVRQFKIDCIVIYEHNHYFETYQYNKKKLLLHKASMDYYHTYLNGIFAELDIIYIPVDKLKQLISIIEQNAIIMFDPIDRIDLQDIQNNSTSLTILDSPSFLLRNEQCQLFRSKYKSFRNHIFYKFVRENCEILEPFKKLKSYDKYNRNAIPNNVVIPIINTQSKDDIYFINKHKQYVNKNFKENLGTTDYSNFAVTHKSCKKILAQFLKLKLMHFGDYQDAIRKDDHLLFHSGISVYINIGLITPDQIIKQLIKFIKSDLSMHNPLNLRILQISESKIAIAKNNGSYHRSLSNKYLKKRACETVTHTKNKITINNIEAFVRQIAGWREYQRYCYLYADFNQNFFNNRNKLTNKHYSGETGISIVDDTIKQVIQYGYTHHINRLMILGNYFNITQVSPQQTFLWFNELFLDAYCWVMHQNVYSMALYADGGQTSSKPYLCSSNYLLNMSNYKRDLWCDKWDQLLRTFIQKNKHKLIKIYGMNWINNF